MAVQSQAPLQQAAPVDPAPAGNSGLPDNQPAASPASAIPNEQETPKDNSWFRDAFNTQRGLQTTGQDRPAPATPETPPASTDTPESNPGREADTTKQAAGQAPKQPTAKPAVNLPKTQEELERYAQANTDRVLAKFQREEANRRREHEETVRVQRERELRQKDPYAYAQLVEQREQENAVLTKQLQSAQTLVHANVSDYDRHVLDPLILSVPPEARAKILEQVEDGIPGRGTIAKRSLQWLQGHWEQQGVVKARKTLMNDQAFVKEVLARYGGQRTEPDSVPATAGAPASGFAGMNDWMRSSRHR